MKFPNHQPVSALSIATYLLSLDPQRKYFSIQKAEVIDLEENYKSKPIIGNFRLNKVLQVSQALHYACYQSPLFSDEIKAYEHGGVVPFIYKNFCELYREVKGLQSSINRKEKEFVSKVFYYLKENYSDSKLRELAHEDLAWQKARQRKLQKKRDSFIYDEEVLSYYQVLSHSLLEAMGIEC